MIVETWNGAMPMVASWVLTYFVHSTVALLAAWLITRQLQSPSQRLTTWRLAMLGGVVTTTVSLAVQGGAQWRFASATVVSVTAIVAATWLGVGAVLFGWRVIRSRRLVTRLRREQIPSEATFPAVVDRLARAGGLSQLVQLSVSDQLVAPVVLGRREVCFPRRLVEQLTDDQLEAVVAHELAHVHRGDSLWLWLTSALETLCFPQWLNRVAGRRVAEDTELVCDDWAAQRTGRRRALAEGIAIVASWMTSNTSATTPRPALGAERSPLLQRVERLLTNTPQASAARSPAALAAVALLLVALSCAGPVVQITSAPLLPASVATDTLIASLENASAVLGTRLLALPAGYEAEHAEFLAVPDTGAARLYQRGRYKFPTKRGGLAHYSFVTRDNDYNRQPMVTLEKGRLSSGFYGGSRGVVVDLGDVELESLSRDDLAAAAPDLAHVTSLLTVPTATSNARESMQQRVHATKINWMPAALADHTYLVRSSSQGEHDALVAMRVTHAEDDGVVFLWRTLADWHVENPDVTRPEVRFDTTTAEPWMFAVPLPELEAWERDARAELQERLLASDSANVVRLLPREKFQDLLTVREGGAYYSFLEREHEFTGASDLQYEQGNLGISNDGGILDIGPYVLADLTIDTIPGHLDDLDTRTWRELTTTASPPTNSVPWVAASVFHDLYTARRAAQRDDLSDTPMVVGHCYLLRAIDDHGDILVAFDVVEQDGYGITLNWRELKRF